MTTKTGTGAISNHARAFQTIGTGLSRFRGYAVVERKTWCKNQIGERLIVIQSGLTWSQACALVEAMPPNFSVAVMAKEDQEFNATLMPLITPIKKKPRKLYTGARFYANAWSVSRQPNSIYQRQK